MCEASEPNSIVDDYFLGQDVWTARPRCQRPRHL